MNYEIKIEPDDNGTWLATVPAFPEVSTFGTSPVDAIFRAEQAIEEAKAARAARGEDIPTPAERPA